MSCTPRVLSIQISLYCLKSPLRGSLPSIDQRVSLRIRESGHGLASASWVSLLPTLHDRFFLCLNVVCVYFPGPAPKLPVSRLEKQKGIAVKKILIQRFEVLAHLTGIVFRRCNAEYAVAALCG